MAQEWLNEAGCKRKLYILLHVLPLTLSPKKFMDVWDALYHGTTTPGWKVPVRRVVGIGTQLEVWYKGKWYRGIAEKKV